MRRTTIALLAALEAAVAALIGLGIVLVPLMLLWAVKYGLTVDAAVFLRAAADVWLLGHGVDLTIQLDPVTAGGLGLPGAGEPSAVADEFLGPDIAEMFRRSGGDGPLPSRLWHEFRVEPSDLLVEKTAASAFFPGRCPLPELLAEREITTVLITGTVTNVCCESSARDASTLGYRVVMVADANAALRDQDLNATLHTIYRSFGDVLPTDEVAELIEASRSRPPAG